MAATQALTGAGRLADDGRSPPPTASRSSPAPTSRPTPRHGLPSFPQLLAGARARPGGVNAATCSTPRAGSPRRSANGRCRSEVRPAGADSTPTLLAGAVAALASGFDAAHGGFGGGAEVPAVDGRSSSCCATTRAPATPRALEMVDATLRRRWPAAASTTSSPAASRATPSTRTGWCRTSRRCCTTTRCCCGVYAHWWRATGDPLAERVVRETADFLLRELRTARGRLRLRAGRRHRGRRGQHLRLDAGAARRGARRRRRRVGGRAARVTDAGTFEHGASTLQLRADPDDPARWDAARARLRAARTIAPQPARDDKVVAAWNGLAIAALAEAGALLGEPSWVDAAEACADLLVERAPRRRPAASGVARWSRRLARRRARGLRLRGRGVPRAASGDR